MPRPATRAQTHDALGRTPGFRLARTKGCRDPRPGLERATRSAVTAPRGPPSSHRRVTHEESGPPDPARRHPGRLGPGRPAEPRRGPTAAGGGVGPCRHGKVVSRRGPEGRQPVPESDSRPAVAMISRRRPNRARRACAANRYRRVPGLGEESDRPEGIGRAPCTDWACPEAARPGGPVQGAALTQTKLAQQAGDEPAGPGRTTGPPDIGGRPVAAFRRKGKSRRRWGISHQSPQEVIRTCFDRTRSYKTGRNPAKDTTPSNISGRLHVLTCNRIRTLEFDLILN